MFIAYVRSEIARLRAGETGTRRVRIGRGTPDERTVELSRTPLAFAGPVPPELAADPYVVVEEEPVELPTAEPPYQDPAVEIAEIVEPGEPDPVPDMKSERVQTERVAAPVAKPKAAAKKKGRR